MNDLIKNKEKIEKENKILKNELNIKENYIISLNETILKLKKDVVELNRNQNEDKIEEKNKLLKKRKRKCE